MHIIRGLILTMLFSTINTQLREDRFVSTDVITFCNGRVSGVYGHPDGCEKFITCYNERATVQRCPGGTQFDVQRAVCDYASQVDCFLITETELENNPTSDEDGVSMVDSIHSEVPLNVPASATVVQMHEMNTAEQTNSCVTDGYFPDATQCGHFIICHRGQKYMIMCPERTSYDPDTNTCGHDRFACKMADLRQKIDNIGSPKTTSTPKPKVDIDLTTVDMNQPSITKMVKTTSGKNTITSQPIVTETTLISETDLVSTKTIPKTSADKRKVMTTSDPRNNMDIDSVIAETEQNHSEMDIQLPSEDVADMSTSNSIIINGMKMIETVHLDLPNPLNISLVSAKPEMTTIPEVEMTTEAYQQTTDLDTNLEIETTAMPYNMTMLGEALIAAMEVAGETVEFMIQMEVMNSSKTSEPNDFSGVSSFLGGSELTKAMGMPAEQQLMAVKMVQEMFDLDKSETMEMMKELTDVLEPSTVRVAPDMDNTAPEMGKCPYPNNTRDNDCDVSAKYRSSDGTCNNLDKPLWGKSFRPFSRFLEPDYADGISEPRQAANKKPLPSARLVINTLTDDQNKPSHVHTLMTMTLGQMIDHDLTRTAVSQLTTVDGEMVDVQCGSDGCTTEGAENRACLPIAIPENDPVFTNKTCLMFVRTQEVPRDECQLGPREQLNQLTSYLDNSHVYGSTATELQTLRDNSNPDRGRLRVMRNANPNYKPLLPQAKHLGEECKETSKPCFLAGDGRVNEQIGLTALQTSWHRYHNFIENILHNMNPEWTGDRLLQESRRITTAVWQHTIFNEWLPITLGKQAITQYGLQLEKDTFFNAYDSTINVEISNAFATAAFRFGHSLIDSLISFTSHSYKDDVYTELSSILRRPGDLYSNVKHSNTSGVDSVLLGQISRPCQRVDQYFSDQITTKLFSEKSANGLGMDLISLNLQRGREHGLPGYNAWREWCGLQKADSFDNLTDISSQAREAFRDVYSDVDDIDLFVGGVSEHTLPGGVMGPTFACIIGRQMRNLRVGDRFWYEREDQITGFTGDQLNEIRKMTLARVFCDTTDGIDNIQKYVMLQPMNKALENLQSMEAVYELADLYRGDHNERRACKEIPQIKFSVFKV